MSRFAKYLALPAADRRLLLRVARHLVLARWCVRVLPFRVLQRLYGLRDGAKGPAAAPEYIEKVRWAIATVQGYLPGTNCLPVALAAHAVLKKDGYASQVRIGVARDEAGHFRAHAWVVSGGSVVVGHVKDLARYAPMEAAPEAAGMDFRGKDGSAMQVGARDKWS